MASYQRVALFVLFDSIERDLVKKIREFSPDGIELADEERNKARGRLLRRAIADYDIDNPHDLLYGLDLLEKFQVLMRHKHCMDLQSKTYYESIRSSVERSIGIRNDVMHGRPLTSDEHVFALSFAQDLLSCSAHWPILDRSYREYSDDPTVFLSRSIDFLDDDGSNEVLNNLPLPDYDDTGFLPRPELERDLKKKILGRHPVVTVLGEGGNGKTALALQVLTGLVRSSDHDFDAILWFTAKTSKLTPSGVREIEDVITSASDIIEQAAVLEPIEGTPLERLTKLLSKNKILLTIDNYETVSGDELSKLAQDVPGNSKLLFTSRLPVGGDLTVIVDELSEKDAIVYFRRLVQAYSVQQLRDKSNEYIVTHLRRLGYKPLLIKWLVLGVKSGLPIENISSNPEAALRFCLDNVIRRLGPEAQSVTVVLSTLPTALSISVIQHISRLSPTQVNDGVAELSRYGLIEIAVTEDGERLYKLKSFSRLFVHRIISPKPEVTNQLVDRYKALELEYQSARGLGAHQGYSMKQIDVQSRSQLLIAKRLRSAADHAFLGDFDLAEQLLYEAKSLDPEYHEVHRIEAIIAQQLNDWPRAVASYETALEIAPDKPHLHFLFGGLLMRMLDNERAAYHLNRARTLDPRAAPVMRECARNELMRYQFDQAQRHLDDCHAAAEKGSQDETIANDLQIQLHVRKVEMLVRTGSKTGGLEEIKKLTKFLRPIDAMRIDARMGQHVLKIVPSLTYIQSDDDEELVVQNLVDVIKEKLGPESLSMPAKSSCREGQFVGYMKEEGRHSTYGFLVSRDREVDTFVHIRTMSSQLWSWLLAGGSVRFDVEPFGKGRTRACNITKYEIANS